MENQNKIAEIESLENELRIAHSEDQIQKANLANHRKLEESRKQHRLEIEKLQSLISELKEKNEVMSSAKEDAEEAKLHVEKRLNKERIETGETINRLNLLLKEAQSNQPAYPTGGPIRDRDDVAKKIDFEPSDITFTNCDFSTPRDPIESATHEVVRKKYIETRNKLLATENDNEKIKHQMQDRLEDFERLTKGKWLIKLGTSRTASLERSDQAVRPGCQTRLSEFIAFFRKR